MDRPVPSGDQIRAIWQELDRPGPEKLRVALQKRGFFAPTVQVLRDHFYKFQSSRQVFQRPPKYTGHAYSEGMDRRWMADVMQMPEVEYEGRPYRYALICVDIFSRFVWGALIDSPMQADEGYREILRRAGKGPSVLLTDEDPGFKTEGFKKALGGTYHEFKVGANDLSIVDRFMLSFKRKQKQQELDGETTNWAKQLQTRIEAFNRSGTPALYQSAPEDLRGPHGEIENKQIYFNRLWDESEGMQRNAKAIQERGEKLAGAAFRTLAPFPGPKRRAGDPVWSIEMRRAHGIDGAFVADERGNRYPTKEVLPVPQESTELTRPVAKLKARPRELLKDYADRLEAKLRLSPDREITAQAAQTALTGGNVHNLKQAMQIAGVSVDGVVANFVKVFPDRFEMRQGAKKGVYVVRLLE